MRLRPITIIAAVAVSLALGACGNKEAKVSHGSTEGTYLNVGGLYYQVQISRQLNPRDSEDRDYLVGVNPADATLKPDETWFAVFMRVQNASTKTAHQAATEYVIRDTQGNVFNPMPLGRDNVFAYHAANVAPKGIIPDGDAAAAETPIQGSLLLFKIPYANLENRPLELEIVSPKNAQDTGTVALDV
jgi:hypothetical protein